MEADLLLNPETYAGLSPAERARVAAVVLAGAPDAIAGQDDDALIQGTRAAEAAGRHLDAFRVRNAGEIAVRSEKSLGEDRLSARLGCRTEIELLQRLTRLPYGQLKRRISLDADTRATVGVTGAPVEPRFPRVAGALHQGRIDPGTAALVTGMLSKVARRADPAGLVAAEGELVDAATGVLGARLARQAAADDLENPDGGEGPGDGVGPGEEPADAAAGSDAADGVGLAERFALMFPQMQKLTHRWESYLDQDGPDPADERAQARRSLTLGALRDGLVPISGLLVPEAAATLQRVFDAYLNPAARTAGADPHTADAESSTVTEAGADGRSPAQKRHDVFMSLLQAASRSAETPSLGGDTATLVVHVNAEDLLDPAGYAHIEGVEVPVSGRLAHRTACTGAVQKVVFDRSGRIIALGSKERTFTGHQRRAIAARDGGCVIPGCLIGASWCEVHHVIPWAQGGRTHTDNGVTVCWFHHHHLENSGWQIRMCEGAVQVKAPPWLNPDAVFEPAPTSETRQRAIMLADRGRQTVGNGGGSGDGGSGGQGPPDPPGGHRRAA